MDTCILFLGVSLVQHIQPMMLAGYAVVTAGSPKKLHSVLQELLIGSNDSRTKGLMGEIWEKIYFYLLLLYILLFTEGLAPLICHFAKIDIMFCSKDLRIVQNAFPVSVTWDALTGM